MTLDFIIERLKVSGEDSKQEVLNALENASADDLYELGNDCIARSMQPKLEEAIDNIVVAFKNVCRVAGDIEEKLKDLDADTIKELLQKEETNGECS